MSECVLHDVGCMAADDSDSYVSEKEEEKEALSRRVTFAPTPELAVPFEGNTGMNMRERGRDGERERKRERERERERERV